MNLVDFFKLKEKPAFISIAGGGGKTATLFELGKRLYGSKVLLTTTTKILKPDESDWFKTIEGISEEEFLKKVSANKIDLSQPVVYGLSSPSYPGKLTGVSQDFLKKASLFFTHIIVEADGSAGRPLKAPAAHEPVISGESNYYIGLIGLDSLKGNGDDSNVHRPELFERIRKKKQNEPIDSQDLIHLINNREGLFKNAPARCRRIVLLNKADLLDRKAGEELCRTIAAGLNMKGSVILNSYKSGDPVSFIQEKL